MKPTSGENSSDLPTDIAWLQSTPDVPFVPCNIWFMRPTPITEPISVCELDDGRPSAQVPRFQMIAAMRSAKTIAKPCELPTPMISSTGSNCRMPNATAPLEINTPMKFHAPDQTTAKFGVNECV